MAKTITAAELFEDVEVDLWGAVYRLREGTRDVQVKLAEAQKALEAADEEDNDAVVGALADVMEALLEPLGDEDGKKVKASTVIRRKWSANELGIDRISAIADGIQDAAESRVRPTSPPTSGG